MRVSVGEKHRLDKKVTIEGLNFLKKSAFFIIYLWDTRCYHTIRNKINKNLTIHEVVSMMTILATIAAIVFVAAGCFIVLRDLYNIIDALASGIQRSYKAEKGKMGNVQLKNVYAAR